MVTAVMGTPCSRRGCGRRAVQAVRYQDGGRGRGPATGWVCEVHAQVELGGIAEETGLQLAVTVAAGR